MRRLEVTVVLWWLVACSTESSAPPKSDAPRAEAPKTKAPTAAPTSAQLPGYDGRFADDPLLTPLDVATIPADRLPYVRNEIFARYGRSFQKDEFKEFFGKKSWYVEKSDYSDAILTEHDKANAELLQSFEGPEKKSRKTLVDAGEFSDGDVVLTFVDEQTIEIGTKGDDLYEWERDSAKWEPRSTGWVITWKGDKGLKKADEAMLWKLTEAHAASLVGTFDPR